MIKGKRIILGITGSIAAYKGIELARGLKQDGAYVTVVMTENAQRFISPLTFEVVSENKVFTDLFDPPLSHITLSEQSDALLVAPATADIINKAASGIGDDLLTTLLLSFNGPIVFAPAMNWRMYENPVVKKNIDTLQSLGRVFVEPVTGRLACGEEGVGRLAPVGDIIEVIKQVVSIKDLVGKKVLVTAGPTREPIDPVRFISNRSSGKMGFALAKAARRRGAEVTLITGPTYLESPYGIKTIGVERADEMMDAVLKNFNDSSIVVMAAAVSDFTPEKASKEKIKKEDISTLSLRKTGDILKRLNKLRKNQILVGFAAETGDVIKKAKDKLRTKNLDIIVVNDITEKGAGFDADTNIVTIIEKTGKLYKCPILSKEAVADIIYDMVLELNA